MRLWSLHPSYLDARGLVALWREGLLAQKVLQGRTRGYRHHPQLIRFQACRNPAGAVAAYLLGIHAEAERRGYSFDRSRVGPTARAARITETRGQLAAEWKHLLRKLRARDPARHARLRTLRRPRAHPLFRVVPGPARDWEKAR
jgi:hypothetical protein